MSLILLEEQQEIRSLELDIQLLVWHNEVDPLLSHAAMKLTSFFSTLEVYSTADRLLCLAFPIVLLESSVYSILKTTPPS
jgi:hypothetical protein